MRSLPERHGLLGCSGKARVVNRRQMFFVIAGLLLFAAGAVIGLRPLEGLTTPEQAMTLPLVHPVEAFTSRPEAALAAVLLPVVGLAVALVGCYSARERR
jgi:hypothetical protein